MWPVTLKSHGGTRGKFVYSDLSMYMLKEVVEQATHRRLNEYVLNEFYLPLGMHGGEKFFDPSTVDLFTSRQSKVSLRGYGFARLTEAEERANKGYPSQLGYGHSGYTGTYVWVDPKYNMVYICLTN